MTVVSPATVHPLTLRALSAALSWRGEGCFEVAALAADQRDEDTLVALPETFQEAPEGDAYWNVLPAASSHDASGVCDDDAEATILPALLSSRGAAPLEGCRLPDWRNTGSPDVEADRRRREWQRAFLALKARGAANGWL